MPAISRDTFLESLRKMNVIVKVDQDNNLDIDAPAGVLNRQIIDEIKARKTELIDYLKDVSDNADIITTIPRTAISASYPLSSSQMRMWIVDSIWEGSAAYNMQSSFELEEAIDIEKFELAIKAVISRHEILRTVFSKDEAGEIKQYILGNEELDFKLGCIDLRHEPDVRVMVNQYIHEDLRRPYDLTQAPLFRVKLFRIADEGYIFYYSMHHIIGDGWSMNILAKDVQQYYEAFTRWTPPPAALSLQYKDFSVWQQQQLVSGAHNQHKEYWIDQFSDNWHMFDLFTDKPRPPVHTVNGFAVRTFINANLTKRLQEISARYGCSLFMSLVASLKALLHRYTGQEDITVGTAIAGRERFELQDQIGCYINNLALRTQIKGEDNFGALLTAVRTTMLNAYRHQAYPFERLIEDLQLKRDTSRSPLFDILVTFQEQGAHAVSVINEDMVQDLAPTVVRLDMELAFQQTGDALCLWLGFNTDLYETATIHRFIHHYKALLEALLTMPETPVQELSFLSNAEQQQLLQTFNDTKANYDKYITISELIAAQAMRTPDAIAILFEQQMVSYRELDLRSNQLAHYLRKLGVGEETLVPVCIERSPEMIIAILGILKAGAAYVPIDSDFPADRIDFILQDIGESIIITSSFCQERVAINENNVLVVLDADAKKLAQEPVSAPEVTLHSGQLAYVMYTSGSTGKPKGVMIEHRSLTNFLHAMEENFTILPGDGWMAVTTFSFDIAYLELFLPLMNGGKIILVSRDNAMDGYALRDAITMNRPAYMQATPVSWQLLVDAGWKNEEDITILCGGEALKEGLKDTLAAFSNCIYNLYGPTETTIWSTLCKLYAGQRVSIGKPIANTRIYITDKTGRLLPVGVPGEMWIGGEGVARGYFKRTELTNKKFIPDPFCNEPQARVYITGDIAKWLPDGTIEYIGRADDQVKIRGYRIEPGEIEESILRYKGISAAAVTVQPGANGEKELAGYYVSDEAISSNDVRSYLRTVLPVYMVPAWLMRLDALPLTANGKINRQALPAVSVAAGERAIGYTEPRTALEAQLAGIWQQLFGGIEIGVEDDFFAIGGHSIKLMQLLNHYQRELDVKLTMQELFRHSTIAAQALLIEKGRPGQYMEIKQVEQSADYTVSNGQRRLWVLSQIEDSSKAYHLPGEVRLQGQYYKEYFEQAIQQVISRHEILRTVFRENEQGELRQVVLPAEAENFQLNYKDFEGASENEIRNYLWNEFCRGFDLGKGPLLRVGLVRLSDEEYILHYTVHHIISDGWSMELLRREVMEYYQQYAEGKTPAVKALRIQYKDYAAWQQTYVSSSASAVHRSYWLQQLSGELPVLELGNGVRPAVQTHNGRVLATVIEKSLTNRLEELCRGENSTLFMGLIAVLKALLYRYTGQEDIIIGSPVAGRTHSELEEQIGFYINVLALRTRFSGEDTVKELLSNIRQVSLLAYEHQSYPVDRLIEELDLKRDSSRSPLFDVFVNLENIEPASENETASTSSSEFTTEEPIIDLGRSACKYDLILNFHQAQDRIHVQIEYNTDIFDQSWVKRLIVHYKDMLQCLVSQPNTSIKEVAYINEKEKQQLTKAFNATATTCNKEATILDLFAAAAAQRTTHTALRMGTETMSYIELDQLSDQVAVYLQQQHNIKENDIVGVQLDRSPWVVVALLGILKTGAAYLPIDNSYPAGRKDYMIDNSDCWLLIDETLLAAMQQHIEKADNNSIKKPTTTLQATQRAYVMYTSGSTGRPKGVQVSHGNLYHYISYALNRYFSDKDTMYRMPLFTSLSFDLTVTSLFGTLCAGGELMIYDQTQEIADVLEDIFYGEKGINIVKCTPAHLGLLTGMAGIPGSVEQVIVGGEELKHQHINTLQNICAHTVIYNEYGPTETTVGCVVEKIQGSVTDNNIAIGQPIQNTQIYLLDTARELVPVGVRGEIYIGGAGVSAGYINNSEQTTERFIANPFGEGTLYKTGDLGRWREDGRLDYLGRIDNQVKVHGYRIEPGEIEQVLLQYEGMRQCVVAVKEDEDHNKQLIGYIVTDTPVDTTPITNYLQDRLPAYMVPSRLMRLEWLPLTTNGKIDMMALPGWDGDVRKEKYEAPRTPVEEALVASWAHIFKKERIGIKDNFFELGGDSIKAILMGSQLKQRGYSVKVADILRYPVLEDLGAYVRIITGSANQEVVAGEVMISPVQQWLLENTGSIKSNLTTSVLLKSRQRLQESLLHNCFEKLVAHHDALRMQFQQQDNTWKQYNRTIQEGTYHFEEHDENHNIDLQTLYDQLQHDIDIAEGPLLKAGLFHLADGDRLLLVMPRLVTDYISWQILLEDLSTLYCQQLDDEKLQLPLKSHSFQHHNYRLQQYANSNEAEKEGAYWRKIDNAIIEQLKWNTTGNAPENANVSHHFTLTSEQASLLSGEVNRVYNTNNNDILLTALSLAVRTVFGVTEILIELEGNGRNRLGEDVNVTRTVGCFSTRYPVLLQLTAGCTNCEQLVRIKEQLRQIPNDGIGYGLLRHTPAIAFTTQNDLNIALANTLQEGVFDAVENYSTGYAAIGNTLPQQIIITAISSSDQLQVKLSCNREQDGQVQLLGNSFERHLKELIHSLRSKSGTWLTPSDLTYKGLRVDELNEIEKSGVVEDVYELSPMQEGIYYHWLANRKGTEYVEQVSYRLSGMLHIPTLQKSYAYLTGRHAILRTRFVHEYGAGCLQVVHKEVDDNFRYENISGLPEPEQYATTYRAKDRLAGFDLGKGTQMRLTVLELGQQQYEFIWSHHHILMDGWCVNILIKEFNEIYQALQRGGMPWLQPVTPYVNYISWLQKFGRDASVQYWNRYLDGYENATPVPFKNRKKEDAHEYQGIEDILELDATQSEAIRQLCRDLEITENTFMQAAWGYLLSRYNNTKDVVFGSVVSGRPEELAGIEEMIGLFVNTIPLRVRYYNGMRVRELLLRIQEANLESLPHHYLRLADIQSAAALKNTLFDHILVYQNIPVEAGEAEIQPQEATLEEMSLLCSEMVGQTNYDFDIIVEPMASHFRIVFRYNQLVYEPSAMNRLKKHLNQVIRCFSDNIDGMLSEVDYLPEEERYQVSSLFNQTKVDYPFHKTIVDLFVEQVKRTPDDIAVVYEQKKLRYRELHKLSNQLANYLRKRGVQEETLVPICIERSLEMIIGILGILKAGGAYVPIDPEFPPGRIAWMLEDAKSPVILTSTTCQSALPPMENSSVIVLDQDWKRIEKEAAQLPKTALTPNHLAYVIYTSGSTGKPKGVMNEHKALVNRLLWAQDHFTLTSHDTVLQKTTFSFDVSVWELIWPLLVGSKMVFAKPERHRDNNYIAQLIEQQQITTLHFVPSMLALFLDEQPVGSCPSLKRIICSGEALKSAHIRACSQRLPHVKLYNLYGPTEAAIDVSCWDIPENDQGAGPVFIGKPVANTSIYILDEQGKLAPIGIAGELCIGGVQVARGYLNQPALTSKKFIPDTFNQESGAKLYRTGDVCRWCADGNIEYLSREDDQVKIRGYRIEPGEIEQVLLQHNEVEAAAVTIRNGKHGEPELVAWYVSKQEMEARTLRRHLKSFLPAYMVPAYFMRIDHLPLTANGKVDRKELSAIEPAESNSQKKYTDARNPVEKALVLSCAEVLRLEQISVKESFFDLGGDSIKAILLINRLKQKGYNLTVTDIINYPVLEDLATQVTSATRSVEMVNEEGDVILTPIQRRFLEEENEGKAHFNQSVLLYAERVINEQYIRQSLEKLVIHHDALRMVFRLQNGEWTQHNGSIDTGGFDLTVADLRIVDDQRTALEAGCEQLQQGVDLQNGPLLKAGLFRMSDGDRLLIVVHHLVTDGVSWRILLEDLYTLYEQAEKGLPMELPTKTDSFRHWARQLQQYASEDLVKAEMAYWQRMDERIVLPLPKDFAVEDNIVKDNKTIGFKLDAINTVALLTRANRVHQTEINDVLLTALAQALQKTFGIDVISVLLEGHGREQIDPNTDISRTVGWFTTEFPVVLDISQQKDSIAQLLAVRETLRSIPVKGIGYGILRYMSSKEMRNGKDLTCKPEILFNYLGDFGGVDNAADNSNSPFRFATENKGREIHPAYRKNTVLDVSGMAINNEIILDVSFSALQFKPATIETLMAHYKVCLQQMIHLLTEQKESNNNQSGASSPLSYNQLYYIREEDFILAYGQFNFHLSRFNKSAFITAYNRWVSSFEMLHTKFFKDNNGWHQEIIAPDETRNKLLFIEDKLLDTGSEKATAAINDMIRTPFDLLQGEVMRCGVIHNENEAYVQVVIHHAATDESSNKLLRKAFIACYEQPEQTLGLSPAYFDFVQKQREYLQTEAGKSQIQYWADQLKTAGLTKRVVISNRKEKKQTLVRNSQYIQEQEYQQLFQFCKTHNIAPSSFVLTAFYLLLCQWYREREWFIIEVVTDGRDMVIPGFEMKDATGQFVNFLPLLLQRKDEITIKNVCQYTQQIYWEGRLRQQVPFHIIDKHFSNKYHTPLRNSIDATINYFDLTNTGWQGEAIDSAKEVYAGENFMNGSIGLRCYAYNNMLQFEWDISCKPDDVKEHIENKPCIAELKRLLNTMIHQPNSILSAFVGI